MDITSLSSGLSQADLMTQISASIMKLTIDTVEQTTDSMIKMMENSVNPSLGGTIDISI